MECESSRSMAHSFLENEWKRGNNPVCTILDETWREASSKERRQRVFDSWPGPADLTILTASRRLWFCASGTDWPKQVK